MNVVRLVLIAAAVPLFAGCDRGTASTTATTRSVDEVRIGYFANLTHAQAVLGVASKDFDNALSPAKVSAKVFNAGPSLVEALIHDQIDIGYVGPGPALNVHGVSHGQGIRVVAGAAANGVLIVARKDAGINALSDLKGKRVATPQLGNTQDISAKYYLTHQLGQRDFNNVIAVANSEQATMMSNGQIDAAWAPEPWGSFLVAQAGAKVIGKEQDLWPQKDFSITVVVTTPEFLKKHPEAVEKVLGVNRLWTQRLSKEPARYVPQLKAALFDLTKKQLPDGVLEAALSNTTFTDEPLAHTFDVMAGWSYELGFTKQKTDAGGLIDASILRKLPAAAGEVAGAKEGA